MCKVLILDPDDVLRATMREFLEARGATVVEADNPNAAVGQLPGVGLVIMDLNLVTHNGRKFLHALRAAGVCIPTLVMTAQRPEEAYEDLCITYWLRKPFRLDEFTSVIDRSLARARYTQVLNESDARLDRVLAKLQELCHQL